MTMTFDETEVRQAILESKKEAKAKIEQRGIQLNVETPTTSKLKVKQSKPRRLGMKGVTTIGPNPCMKIETFQPVCSSGSNNEVIVLDDSEGDNTQIVQRRFRFTIGTEIELLREVLAFQPFAAKYGEIGLKWVECAKRLGKYNGETAKKHVEKLLEDFNNRTKTSKTLSGTDEEETEHDKLLQDISDLVRDHDSLKKQKKDDQIKAKDNEFEAAAAVRAASLKGIVKVSKTATKDEQKSSKSSPSNTQKGAKRAYDDPNKDKLLEDRNKHDKKIQKEKLQLKKSFLALEERRLELAEKKLKLQEENAKAEAKV